MERTMKTMKEREIELIISELDEMSDFFSRVVQIIPKFFSKIRYILSLRSSFRFM